MESILTASQIRHQRRYQRLKKLSARELIDDYYKLTGRRRRTPPRECDFQHPMRIVDYRAWYCDDRECQTLLVGLEIPILYDLHKGTRFLVFNRYEAKEYLDGKTTLRELVLERIEKHRKENR